jgi:hypothetical protein
MFTFIDETLNFKLFIMKKITLLAALLVAFYSNAQDTCATAISITAGSTTTVAIVDGTEIPTPECALNATTPDPRSAGEWYTYTAGVDGFATVSSDLGVNTGGDTRFHVFSGDCMDLACVGGNDDVSGSNFLSEADFPVTAGETYYIAWDDRWDDTGFDFTLTETSFDCDFTLPYEEDFSDTTNFTVCLTSEDTNADGLAWGRNDVNDLDGDGIEDPIANIFPSTADGSPEPGFAKDDWLFFGPFSLDGSSDYVINVTYNGIDVNNPANESFEIVALDEPSSFAPTQNVLQSFSDITQQGDFAAGTLIDMAYDNDVTYTSTSTDDVYFAIHATSPASGDVFAVFTFNVNTSLSVDEFQQVSFSQFVDSNNILNMSSNKMLEQVTIYNILGREMKSLKLSSQEAQVNIADLSSGIYLAKISINGQNKSFKLIKK